MTRSFRIATTRLVVLALLSTHTVSAVASGRWQQQSSDEPLLVGRLATVEPSARRISMIPEGETERVELLVAADGQILQDAEELTLSDLVIQIGSRVRIRYRTDNGVHIARTITVDPPPAE